MAYRRISSKFTLFTRSHHPSPLPSTSLLQHKLHHYPSPNPIPHPLSDNRETIQHRQFASLLPLGIDSIFSRHYSSSPIGENSEKIDYMNDVAEVLTEKTIDSISQSPVVNEVAIAAADSAYPVALLQYLIDGIHSFTGFNWWASIALTTIMIRSALIPLLIHQLRATSKFSLMRPQMEEIKEQMDNSMDPKAMEEGKKRMQKLFIQYGVTPFTPLKGLFIQGPVFVSFFFAISNMAEKVPSFNEGGIIWFVDLTTPDPLYILPVMTALTFLANVELNTQEGLEGNPVAGTMKKFSRVVAVATVPFTMNFPKAIFCYWLASNLFSLVYGSVIKLPYVKKLIGLPDIPPPGPSAKQTSFSLFGKSKSPSSSPASQVAVSQPKIPENRTSSSAVISQRIRSLERSVKGRKKKKNR